MHGSRGLTVDGRAKPSSGVGHFCCELIRLGIAKIAELARERFGGETSVHLCALVCEQDTGREASRVILISVSSLAAGREEHARTVRSVQAGSGAGRLERSGTTAWHRGRCARPSSVLKTLAPGAAQRARSGIAVEGGQRCSSV
jgi:hypothetical protein